MYASIYFICRLHLVMSAVKNMQEKKTQKEKKIAEITYSNGWIKEQDKSHSV